MAKKKKVTIRSLQKEIREWERVYEEKEEACSGLWIELRQCKKKNEILQEKLDKIERSLRESWLKEHYQAGKIEVFERVSKLYEDERETRYRERQERLSQAESIPTIPSHNHISNSSRYMEDIWRI